MKKISNKADNGISLKPDELSGAKGNIARAMKGTFVRTLKIEDLEDRILEFVNMAYFETKFTIPEEHELALMARQISNDVVCYFTTITIEEVGIAFKMGVRKKFGDFHGLSVATFNDFLQKYVQCADRSEVKKAERAKLHKEPEPPTEEEKRIIAIKASKECFRSYKESGRLIDYGNAVFKFLEREGIIRLTNERKLEIKKIVKPKITKGKEMELKVEAGSIRRNELKKAIEDLKLNPKSTLLKYECRIFALREYFDNLIEMEMELELNSF